MIDISASAPQPVEVNLVGTVYTVTPPKSALAFKVAVYAKTHAEDAEVQLKALHEWIDKAFGKTQAAKVKKRLEDSNDLLDYEHIGTLMEKVSEAVAAGNPTS